MDDQSFELLRRLVGAQTDRIRRSLQTLGPDERGATYGRFVTTHLDAIEALATAIATDFATAVDAEKDILGRKLYRLSFQVDDIHGNVFDYRDDVGRRDLPVGLLHLVDALIEDLLKASADPVIHSDDRYMYSTQRIVDQWAPLSADLGVLWVDPTEPIVFNLPGLDPANAMLSPILAHEVGHSVIRRSDLVAVLEARLDASEVDQRKADLATADPTVDIDSALDQFSKWAEELLCDALATELTGPSLLLSSAVFLPASAAGQSGTEHPDPAQRIAMTLDQLNANGWEDALTRLAPGIVSWLNDVIEIPANDTSARETFLRDLVAFSAETIRDIAKEYVDRPLDWVSFEPSEQELRALIEQGVPPAEIAGTPVSPWRIILSCWFYGVSRHGDSSAGLVLALEDADLSRFALKSVEMARVLQLWQAA